MRSVLARQFYDIVWIREQFLNNPFEILTALKHHGFFAGEVFLKICECLLRLIEGFKIAFALEKWRSIFLRCGGQS